MPELDGVNADVLVAAYISSLTDKVQAMSAKLDVVQQQMTLEMTKRPIGMKTIKTNATTAVRTLILPNPWIRFSLTNESRDFGIFYSINSEDGLQDNVMLDPGQSITIDMTYPLIQRIHLKAETGTVNVELVGIEGQI